MTIDLPFDVNKISAQNVISWTKRALSPMYVESYTTPVNFCERVFPIKIYDSDRLSCPSCVLEL